MKAKHYILILALSALIALSIYYYQAIYLPSLSQAQAINTLIEAER